MLGVIIEKFKRKKKLVVSLNQDFSNGSQSHLPLYSPKADFRILGSENYKRGEFKFLAMDLTKYSGFADEVQKIILVMLKLIVDIKLQMKTKILGANDSLKGVS